MSPTSSRMAMWALAVLVVPVLLTDVPSAAAATARPTRHRASVREPLARRRGIHPSISDSTKKAVAQRVASSPEAKPPSRNDANDYTIKGGQEGTVFRGLTVEGEDRIHVEFERPELTLDLDPTRAPGLEWGTAQDVLDRTAPELASPLVAMSATQLSPYFGRPWLSDFASGPVARFQPAVTDVERWRLVVVDAGGQAVTSFAGKGSPPHVIEWDGRSRTGAPVTPGLTYSYFFEAYDRAGNKRNIIGQGFSVPAYRLEGPEGPTLLLSARGLGTGLATDREAGAVSAEDAMTPPILLEAASWMNQAERITRPIQITATARTYEQASQLAHVVVSAMAPLLLGDPARIKSAAVVEPDAPEGGTLAIGPSR